MTVKPYPGLRPFMRTETDIFFGREEQTDELIEKLAQTRFLPLVGPSGCGKSSLVRAGLIAGLETSYMAKEGSRWRLAMMRPGNNPMKRLAAAISGKSALGLVWGERDEISGPARTDPAWTPRHR